MTRTSAGTQIGLTAAAPNTWDEAGYSAGTYTTIGKPENVDGDLGRKWDLVTFEALDTRGVEKLKGGYNLGSLNIQCALVPGDAGQTACRAAESSDDDYYFQVSFRDGSKLWFPALVMSFTTRIGASKDVTRAMLALEIDIDPNEAGIVWSS